MKMMKIGGKLFRLSLPSHRWAFVVVNILMLLSTFSHADESIATKENLSNLPAWFDNSRLQAHLLLGAGRNGSELNIEVVEFLRDRNINVFTRHVKTDWRPPVWFGKADDQLKDKYGISNNYQLITHANELASKYNIRVGAYYWNGGDSSEGFANYSDFVRLRKSVVEPSKISNKYLCKDSSGNYIASGRKGSYRGLHADLSSAYKEHVLQGLETAVALGFSMLFFDERHYPNAAQSPCFGSELEQSYMRSVGSSQKTQGWKSSNNWPYVGHQAAALTDTFKYWQQSINARRIESKLQKIPFVISGTYLSTLVYPHMSFDLATIADSVKTEHKHGLRKSLGGEYEQQNLYGQVSKRVQQSLAWIIARDFAEGRPPYVWKHRSGSKAEQIAFVSDVILHGGVAAMHIADVVVDSETVNSMPESSRQNQLLHNTSKAVIDAAIPHASRLAELYSSSRPINEVTLLIEDPSVLGIYDPSERLKHFVEPLRVWATQLSIMGLPFRVINAQQFLDTGVKGTSVVVIGKLRSEVMDSLKGVSKEKLVVGLNTDYVTGYLPYFMVDSIAQGVELIDNHALSAIKVHCSTVGSDNNIVSDLLHPLTTFHWGAEGQMLLGVIPERDENYNSKEALCRLEIKETPVSISRWSDGSDLRVEDVEKETRRWQIEKIVVKTDEVITIRF